MNFLKYVGTHFPFAQQTTDGEFANAATFNGAYLSTDVGGTVTGPVVLADPDTTTSGPTISGIQRELAALNSFLGKVINTVKNALPSWTNNDVGASTDDVRLRTDNITAKFNATLGHAHSSAPGDGAPVSAADLDNFNNYFAELQTFARTTVTGTTLNVTTNLSAKTPGGGDSAVGVYTTAPLNRCELTDSDDQTEITDAFGNLVYGRITESAGTWTLSFYSVIAAVETAYSMVARNFNVYFAEVFTAATRPTRGAELGLIPSLNLTQDIIDASATQSGKVNTGTQSFGGNKTFTGTVAASNLSGTNTGDVTLAAIGSVPNANGASLSGQVLTLQPADSTFGGVLTAIAQSIQGLKTFAAGVVAQTIARFEGWLETEIVTDSTTTGADQTLAEPTKHVVRVTNASLASITGITAPTNSKARHQILINRTGATVTIKNDAGTAANRILTGTAANMSLLSNAALWLVYDFTTTKWQVVGGSGGSTSPLTTKGDLYTYSTVDARLPVGANGFSIVADSAETTGLKYEDRRLVPFATASISAAATITAAANMRELRRIQGNAAAVTANTTTPITAGTTEGQELILKGMSDTNTVTITNSGNVSLNGDMVFYASSVLSLVWVDSKWLEVARKI